MAYADYLHCIRCDRKALYDANVDYDYEDFGDIWAVCRDCVSYVTPPKFTPPDREGGEQ